MRARPWFPGLSLVILFRLSAGGQPIPSPTPAPTLTAPSTAAASRVHRVDRSSGTVRVDGVLEEVAWERAEKIELPIETFPGDNVPARVKTYAQIAYDGDRLYVAFYAQDPEPGKIRAHLSDRDRAFSDDFVGIVLDTFNDERRGVEFFVNPLGVQMDLAINDVGGGEDETWDALWQSAGRITPSGYTVELAIPFSSLRFRKANGEQTWGLDLVRVYPRGQRYLLRLQSQDRNKSCYLCQISKLVGFEGITPGRNIELDPTLTSQRTDERADFPDGRLDSGGIDADPGLTARWGVTPNLTLNAALNPDFSQVEADVAQLDVNTPFALFFPEKRPLFLEGADFFATPLTAVYTRTVADPQWALKLTGKESRSALGSFFSRDEVTNLILPGSQSSDLASLDEKNLSGVLRYRFDLGKSSTVGALYAGRQGDDYSNHVLGADAYIRLSKADTISAQLLGSRSRYPDSFAAEFDQPTGSFEDGALYFDYRHNTRNWWWHAEYSDIGGEFRADSGFLPQVDYRRPIVGLEHTWWGAKDAPISRIYFGGDWDRTVQRHDGRELEEEWEAWLGISGPLQSFVKLDGGVRDVFFNGVQFRGHKFLNFFFEMRPVGDFYFNIEGTIGDRVDFANTREGDRVWLEPKILWNVGRHVSLELDHTYEKFDEEGGRLFTANLSQLRAIYQFDIRTFVRAILQYTDVERNKDLYVDEVDAKERHLFTQLLFAYKINPQTVFFVGYSDTRLGDERIDLKQVNRTVFVKLGYAWLL